MRNILTTLFIVFAFMLTGNSQEIEIEDVQIEDIKIEDAYTEVVFKYHSMGVDVVKISKKLKEGVEWYQVSWRSAERMTSPYQYFTFENRESILSFFKFMNKCVNHKGQINQDVTEYYPQLDGYTVTFYKEKKRLYVRYRIGEWEKNWFVYNRLPEKALESL